MTRPNIIDIETSRQPATASHQHLTALVEELPAGVISIDGGGRIAVFNRAAGQTTGYRREDALGQPIRSVFSGAEAFEPNMRFTRNFRNLSLTTKSGKRIAVSGTMTALEASAGAVIVFEGLAREAPLERAGRAGLERTASATAHMLVESNTLRFGRFRIVAVSDSMKRVLAVTQRVALSDATTVLIEGESGTGKDLVAQFLHHSSKRGGVFVAVNCAAIPEALLESELFGHERGAFTDARADKKGLFEVAHGGTLFLDEIGELSACAQAKLLRVLDDQTFRRVGGVREIQVSVRVIAATNRHLVEAVRQRTFRTDLFHRLSAIPIRIPPLRERSEDILPLAHDYAAKYKDQVTGISGAAAEILLAHHWPGNVRELRNVIDHAVLMGDNNPSIQAASIHFASVPEKCVEARMPGLSLRDSECLLIERALTETGGNVCRAAGLLGITRDTLRSRLKKRRAVTT